MQLRKVVLGLAAVTLLASCGAKQITKDEAIKIAKENYDSSNQVYKSAHVKVVVKYTYSDNVPADQRDEDSTQENDFTDPKLIADLRINSAAIEKMDEKTTVFKADGKKLEISSSTKTEVQGSIMEISGITKVDEIGYTVEYNMTGKQTVIISSGEEYVITMQQYATVAWTK